MIVRECMTQSPEVGNPNMTLREVAQRMRDGDFGALPIGDNDRLVGMVTDRDITIRAVAEGMNPEQTTVREIMSDGKVLYCFEDQTLEEVTETLGDNQVRRLPVLNRQKRLVGILSLGDVAQSNLSAKKTEDTLNRISQPHH